MKGTEVVAFTESIVERVALAEFQERLALKQGLVRI
jgi:hypothetical protein